MIGDEWTTSLWWCLPEWVVMCSLCDDGRPSTAQRNCIVASQRPADLPRRPPTVWRPGRTTVLKSDVAASLKLAGCCAGRRSACNKDDLIRHCSFTLLRTTQSLCISPERSPLYSCLGQLSFYPSVDGNWLAVVLETHWQL